MTATPLWQQLLDMSPGEEADEAFEELERRMEYAPLAYEDARPLRKPVPAVANAITATATMHCRCRLYPWMTRDELVALGGGCTMPMFSCPRLDAVRRRLGL